MVQVEVVAAISATPHKKKTPVGAGVFSLMPLRGVTVDGVVAWVVLQQSPQPLPAVDLRGAS